jgi:hypothetical protein
MPIAVGFIFFFFENPSDFFSPNKSRGMAGAIAGGEDVFKKVFRQVQLVTQFKNCWRIRNYYVNKATREWAISGDIEIEPVLFRGNVDAFKAAALEPLFPRIRIGAMVWPPDIDPTSFPPSDKGPSVARAWRHKFNSLVSFMDSTAHAQHIRSLSVRMSLRFDLSPLYTPGMDVNALGLGWKYEPAKMFLAALAQCSKIEHLTIEQSDYVQHNADRHTVQVKVQELIKKMQGLRSLEWNGNTVSYRRYLNETDRRGSLFDYLGPSVRELYIKDGPEPRMDAWKDRYGIHAAFGNLMANNYKDVSLETLYMPRSFWSLVVPTFNAFIRPINSGSLARIGFADPFTLMEGPTETMVDGRVVGIRRRVGNPPPHLALHYLITHLSRDITIDFRVKECTAANTERAVRLAANTERAVRIEWLVSLPSTHAQFWGAQRDDSEEFSTFSYSKLHPVTDEKFTVRVLV